MKIKGLDQAGKPVVWTLVDGIGRWLREDGSLVPREGPSTKVKDLWWTNDVPSLLLPFDPEAMRLRYLAAMLKKNEDPE